MKRKAPIFTARLRVMLGGRQNLWLAQMSGLSTSLVSRLLSGKKSPSHTSLTAIASAFKATVYDLVHGTEYSDLAEDPFVPRALFDRVTQQLNAAQSEIDRLKADRVQMIEDHRIHNKQLRASLLGIARAL